MIKLKSGLEISLEGLTECPDGYIVDDILIASHDDVLFITKSKKKYNSNYKYIQNYNTNE